MQISIPRMGMWQNIETFQIQDGGRMPIENRFLALGAIVD